MAKLPVSLDKSFAFGGKDIFVQFVELDGANAKLALGKVRGLSPDHELCELIVIQNTLRTLKVDSKDIDLSPRDDGRSNVPRIWNGDTRELLHDRLIKMLVNGPDAPETWLVEAAPATFEKYVEEVEAPAPPTVSSPVTSQPIHAVGGE